MAGAASGQEQCLGGDTVGAQVFAQHLSVMLARIVSHADMKGFLLEDLPRYLGGLFVLFMVVWYLERRHKLVSDIRMTISFGEIIFNLFEGKKKKHKRRTFVKTFDEAVQRWPNKVAVEFVDDGRKLTFKEIDEGANRLAHLLAKKGVKKREVVGVYMTNKPEYIITELAVAKLGGVSALLNYNLRKSALARSITAASPKLVVSETDLVSTVEEVESELPELVVLLWGSAGHKNGNGFTYIDDALDSMLSTPPDPRALDDVDQEDPLALVYTSGTTGMPKAAIIKHKRCYVAAICFARMFGITEDDRLYEVLPLYHSAGGNIGLGLMINVGATLVLRSKFSARSFFKDACEHGVTVVQYIGEICRYLILTPATSYDTRHKIRLAFGNGLRADVWREFTRRFNIDQIGEFYGSTEGNVIQFNRWRTGDPVGAIGKAGLLNKLIFKWAIVKYDEATEAPLRNAKGRCIQCARGQPGELIAEINGNQTFDGYYKNTQETNKKILRDVFCQGDAYFRTGDLVMLDGQSYLYFVDRIGDTFRWNGENVSTSEVAMALAPAKTVDEVTIVGVEVPGAEGRACMAAVTVKEGEKLDLDDLVGVARASLPSYAVPRFVRVVGTELDKTGTYKLQKSKYRAEGIKVDAVADPLYWLDPEQKKYAPFTAAAYERITKRSVKL